MEDRVQYIVSSGYGFSEPQEVLDQFMLTSQPAEVESRYSNNKFIISCRKEDGQNIFEKFINYINGYISRELAGSCDVFDTVKVFTRPNTQIEEDLGENQDEAPGGVLLPVAMAENIQDTLLIVHETVTKTWTAVRSTDPLDKVFNAEALREIARTTGCRVEIEENWIVIRGDDEVDVDKAIQKINVINAANAERNSEQWENNFYIHEGEINYMLRLTPLERATDRNIVVIATRQSVRLAEITMLKWHNPIEGYQSDPRKFKPYESPSQACRLWESRGYQPIGPERNNPINWNSNPATLAAKREEAKAHPMLPVDKVLSIKEWNLRALAISDPFSAPGADLEVTQVTQPEPLQVQPQDPPAQPIVVNVEHKVYKKTKRVIKAQNIDSGDPAANHAPLPPKPVDEGILVDVEGPFSEALRPTATGMGPPPEPSLLSPLDVMPPPIDEPYMPEVDEDISPGPSEAGPDDDELPAWSTVLIPAGKPANLLANGSQQAAIAAGNVPLNRGPRTHASALKPKVVVDKAPRDVAGKNTKPLWTTKKSGNLAENDQTGNQGVSQQSARQKNIGWPRINKSIQVPENNQHSQSFQSKPIQDASSRLVAGPSNHNHGPTKILKIVEPKNATEIPIEKKQTISEVDTRKYRRAPNLKASASKTQNFIPTSAIIKILESTTSILQMATSIKGQITFEVQIGKFYVNWKHLPVQYRDPGFKASEWKSVFKLDGGDELNFTIFSGLLTTSFVDAEHILDLHFESGQRLFDEGILEQKLTYEFKCRFIQTDKEMILELNEDGSFIARRPEELVGANHWHFIKRRWDARLAVIAFSEADKEFRDALQELVNNVYVPPNAELPEISTWIKDIQIESVVVKRRTRHRCYKYPDVVLQLTENHDLIIEQPSHRHYRAYSYPASRMESEGNRLWWEVSLTSDQAQDILQANQRLEIGEVAAWNPQDFVDKDIIRGLYNVANAVVTRIDNIGVGTRPIFNMTDNSIGMRSRVAASKRDIAWGPVKKRNYW